MSYRRSAIFVDFFRVQKIVSDHKFSPSSRCSSTFTHIGGSKKLWRQQRL